MLLFDDDIININEEENQFLLTNNEVIKPVICRFFKPLVAKPYQLIEKSPFNKIHELSDLDNESEIKSDKIVISDYITHEIPEIKNELNPNSNLSDENEQSKLINFKKDFESSELSSDIFSNSSTADKLFSKEEAGYPLSIFQEDLKSDVGKALRVLEVYSINKISTDNDEVIFAKSPEENFQEKYSIENSVYSIDNIFHEISPSTTENIIGQSNKINSSKVIEYEDDRNSVSSSTKTESMRDDLSEKEKVRCGPFCPIMQPIILLDKLNLNQISYRKRKLTQKSSKHDSGLNPLQNKNVMILRERKLKDSDKLHANNPHDQSSKINKELKKSIPSKENITNKRLV